jgi:quinol monooxygenase YgiN
MTKFALYVRLQAKPGKEQQVVDFLKSALPLVQEEEGTVHWFALDEDHAGSYSIFDTFDTEEARDAHLNGKVGQALGAKAEELFREPPQIHKIKVLAEKD